MPDHDPLFLLTGASGFIGQRVRDGIEREGHRLRVLTRHPSASSGKTDYFQGDITNPESCRVAMQGVQKVIHVAGEKKRPELMAAVNVQGTANLLSAALAAGVRKFVHVSSVGVIGADPLEDRVYAEEAACFPRDDYEKSKRQAEQKVLGAVDRGLAAVILRPVSVFGEGDPNFVNLARLVRKKYFFFPGGDRTWANAVYVDDVAAACLALSRETRPQRTFYHLSCDIPLPDFVNAMAQSLGVSVACLSMPSSLVPLSRGLLRKMRSYPAMVDSLLFGRLLSLHNRARYATEGLRRELGFAPPVGWRQGLARMIAFNREKGLL